MSATTISGWRDAERKKTAAAFLASVIVHLVIILLLGIMIALRPHTIELPVEEAPVELTIVEPPPMEKPKPSYIETSESQRTDQAPANPAFESDKNTAAASIQPATGDMPVPSQDGRESPTLEFENKDYTPGREARPSAPAAPSQPQQAVQPAPQSTPQPTPVATPQPTPAATPQPTPVPDSTPRLTSQLALLEPPKPVSTPRPQTQQAQPAVQQQPPQTASRPGYQPQTRITRIQGNISNRGRRSSVDAVSTPLGRYKKMLSDAIGSRWYYYVNDQMGLLTMGTVELRFIVTKDGKAKKVQVVRNSSNESFASCSVRAVVEAEIPPIPAELIPMLDNGQIEIEYSFTILSN